MLQVRNTKFDLTLRNIVSRIVAGPICECATVHDFESVDNKIIEVMIRKLAFAYQFKRKDRAKTLGNISAATIVTDRTINPALLLQDFPFQCKGQEIFLLVEF